MIQSGIPPDRGSWPGGLLEHLKKYRQGDVVEGFPAVYLGDPSVPVHALTAAYEGQGPGPIEFDDFPYGMLVSQTCDIREEDSSAPSRPWVQICPVYNGEAKYRNRETKREGSLLGSNIRDHLTQGGRGYRYLLYLPEFPSAGVWVADFRLLVPTDKGWLARREPLRPFASEQAANEVGKRIATLHQRPALDGRFEAAVRAPLTNSLRALDTEDQALATTLWSQIHEFAVLSDDNINMNWAQVWILSSDPLTQPVRNWLEERASEWQINAADQAITLLQTQFVDLPSMSAQEYVRLTPMPFD